jgi:hypothetical protein
MTRRDKIRFSRFVLGAFIMVTAPPVFANVAPMPDLIVNQVDARSRALSAHGVWNNESGGWRTKTEFVIDRASRMLTRREYTVWDPAPSRHLDFVWEPEPGTSTSGPKVSGSGRLLWRRPNRPPYDELADVSEFLGTLNSGKAEGFGIYRTSDGVTYRGMWHDGVMQGAGQLSYPNGDEYQGTFDGGVPSGSGRYVDSTGEIYEGSFVQGMRDGRGTTILPNGRSYNSVWHGGVEEPTSHFARLAQEGVTSGSSVSRIKDDIRLSIQLNQPIARNYVNGEADFNPKDFVTFSAFGTDRNIQIQPAIHRLMDVWKGTAPISLMADEELESTSGLYGVVSVTGTGLAPLDLSLQVQNHSTASVQITGAYIDVLRSFTDYQPAMQISVGSDNECVEFRQRKIYSPTIRVENFGWGAAINAEIEYSFVAPGTEAPQVFQERRQLGQIDRLTRVSFEDELHKAGMPKLPALPKRAISMWKNNRDYTSLEMAKLNNNSGSFYKFMNRINASFVAAKTFGSLSNRVKVVDGRLFLDVAGRISYDWVDADRQTHHRISPFRSELSLGQMPGGAECGEGSDYDLVRREPLMFKNDQSGYRLALPFDRSIPAGRIARYSVLLDARRASQHDFAFVLQFADGQELRSRPIHALFFRPRWAPDKKY